MVCSFKNISPLNHDKQLVFFSIYKKAKINPRLSDFLLITYYMCSLLFCDFFLKSLALPMKHILKLLVKEFIMYPLSLNLSCVRIAN